MNPSKLLLLGTLSTGCLPELEPTDANGTEIGESCTTIGINPNLADSTLVEEELLEAYGADYATRLAISLEEDAHYISGEVKNVESNQTGNLTCMTAEAGTPCEVDLYTENTQACADIAGNWIVTFNEEPSEVSCWYIGREGEDPTCTLEGSTLSIQEP